MTERHVAYKARFWQAEGGMTLVDYCTQCGKEWPCEVELRDRYIEGLKDALEGMVYQFAYWSDSAGGHHTGGLSALEYAFDVLGWDDPHPAPDVQCDEPGCTKQVSTGWPTRPGGTGLNGGYRRTCGDHYHAAQTTEGSEDRQPAPPQV